MRLAIAGAQHFHLLDLLQSLSTVPEVEWVGVWNIHNEFKTVFETQYPMPEFPTLEALLDQAKPDGVACFDMIGRRADTIIQCLQRGIHVLADKPPVATEEQLQALEEALRSTKATFTALFSERYNPPVYTLKQLIAAGTVGEIVNFTAFRPHKLKKTTRPNWMFQRDNYGGILVDLAVHDIDVFQWLTGAKPVLITAAHSNTVCPEFPEFEDNGQIFFKADNGAVGFIKVEWLAPEAFPTHGDCRYFITGAQGTLEVFTGGDITDRGGKVILCTHRHPPELVPLNPMETGLYADFLAKTTADGPTGSPMITVSEIISTMRVALAARKAADRNCMITLDWN